jgi:hypothetical protein
MAERQYRVAVVGAAGTWGRKYLRTYASHPRCRIIAIADTARERRQAFADRYGVDKVFDTIHDLLAWEVPDIVSAIVPTGYNHEVVTACARAGVRAVSCEKPISAILSEADEMVRVCREHGTAFGCGQALWGTPLMPEIIDWVRAGNIGALTHASIPGGLPLEASGGGCVQLAAMRLLTGMEVEWVEGWTLPPAPTYAAPPGRPEIEADRPAYGRLGLSGGMVCDLPLPREPRPAAVAAVEGVNGRVYLSRPPVLIQGRGAEATPVFPAFFDQPQPVDFFVPTVERLMRALDTGEEAASSGHDYRQSLEIAIALVRSAADGHRRLSLPLADRSLRLYAHPYRMRGGDRAGWTEIGYKGPPDVE